MQLLRYCSLVNNPVRLNLAVEKIYAKTCNNSLFHTKHARVRIINEGHPLVYLIMLYVSLFCDKTASKVRSRR